MAKRKKMTKEELREYLRNKPRMYGVSTEWGELEYGTEEEAEEAERLYNSGEPEKNEADPGAT